MANKIQAYPAISYISIHELLTFTVPVSYNIFPISPN